MRRAWSAQRWSLGHTDHPRKEFHKRRIISPLWGPHGIPYYLRSKCVEWDYREKRLSQASPWPTRAAWQCFTPGCPGQMCALCTSIWTSALSSCPASCFLQKRYNNTCHEQGQTSDLYPGPEVMEQLLNPCMLGITWPGFFPPTRTAEAQFLGMLLEKIYFQQVTAHSGDCRV